MRIPIFVARRFGDPNPLGAKGIRPLELCVAVKGTGSATSKDRRCATCAASGIPTEVIMDPATATALDGLLIVKIVLGVLCFGSVLAVSIAAWLDLRERRRWRAIVPPCWPPPGVDPEAAYASDLVRDEAPVGHPISIHEGDER